MNRIYLITLGFLLACEAPQGNDKNKTTESGNPTFKEEDFGEDWAFTVPEIECFCEDRRKIYIKANDKVYAVNGKAKATAEADDIPLFHEIQKDGVSIPNDIFQACQNLCAE